MFYSLEPLVWFALMYSLFSKVLLLRWNAMRKTKDCSFCLHLSKYSVLKLIFPFHQVQAAIRTSGGSKTSISEGVEASVIYVRFKAAASEVTVSFFFSFQFWKLSLACMNTDNVYNSIRLGPWKLCELWLILWRKYLRCGGYMLPLALSLVEVTKHLKFFQLKPVLEEIESRSSRKAYVQILEECHKLYCEQRLSLVSCRLDDFKVYAFITIGTKAVIKCLLCYNI